MRYRSVIGYGEAKIIDKPEQMKTALKTIMGHYGGDLCDISSSAIDAITIVEIKTTSMSGKEPGI
jgi:nitroimidazol reductase NimA-like FMN-containing flavoprotein (pyridoxamine 5'-phosphate oxidase superfamily)